MGTRTISLSDEAYERLRAHRRSLGDSFSRVVLRAQWKEPGITGGELLQYGRNVPPFFTESEWRAIEAAKSMDPPPEDKWTKH